MDIVEQLRKEIDGNCPTAATMEKAIEEINSLRLEINKLEKALDETQS